MVDVRIAALLAIAFATRAESDQPELYPQALK
jgi:hypothetical protein